MRLALVLAVVLLAAGCGTATKEEISDIGYLRRIPMVTKKVGPIEEARVVAASEFSSGHWYYLWLDAVDVRETVTHVTGERGNAYVKSSYRRAGWAGGSTTVRLIDEEEARYYVEFMEDRKLPRADSQ